jgi:hypothetical protein
VNDKILAQLNRFFAWTSLIVLTLIGADSVIHGRFGRRFNTSQLQGAGAQVLGAVALLAAIFGMIELILNRKKREKMDKRGKVKPRND